MAVPVIALFAKKTLDSRLAEHPRSLMVWRAGFRWSWGIAAWLVLAIVSPSLLHEVFSDQDPYLLSGSHITVWPAVFWAMLIGWVCLGSYGEASDPNALETVDQRIDALGRTAEGALKFAGCALLVVIGLIAIYVVSGLVNSRIDEMSTNEAIIGGALVIALALYAGLAGRK